MGDRQQEDAGYSLAHVVKPQAWDRWLADLPESKNIEDWRTPVQKAEDNQLWRLTWDPTYETPYEQFAKPLVQFPPAPPEKKLTPSDEIYADWVKSKSQPVAEKPTAPDWLRDQETQWVKTKAKR